MTRFRSRARTWPTGNDVLLVGTLLVWALIEAILDQGPGTTPARVAFAVVTVVPLIARRRFPVMAIVVVAGATVAWAVNASRPEAGTMPFPCLLLALFSVALYARSLLLAVAGGLAAIAAMLITIHTSFYDTTPTAGNTAILLFFSVGTWMAGWLVRQRALHARRAYAESGELARLAVSEERTRIARELHDIVAHSISIIVVQAGAAEQLLEQSPTAAKEHLTAVRRTARDTMGEMRRLLGVLREDDPTYAPQPGLSRLPELLEEIRGTGVRVALSETGQPRPLPAGIDLVAFRVVQESLTNVRKHAVGSRARVELDYHPRQFCLRILNTPGTTMAEANGNGHGLIGMRERVRIFGGEFTADAGDDGGFRVEARLPLEDDAA